MLRQITITLSILLSLELLASDIFRFRPPHNTQFTRTLTRTARIEFGGMVRTETTIFKADFVFKETISGYHLEMIPVSFEYVVNDREVPSPVWELIRGQKLSMYFNVVGKLTETRGYETIDSRLERESVSFSPNSPSMHLDRFRIREEERANWDERILLWLSQPCKPGTKLEFDSSERGFTGERIMSHTTLQVLRAKKCGTQECVVTRYTMIPDLTAARHSVNERADIDLIDATASEELEQVIEPNTMLPHYERLTWRTTISTAAQEFAYRKPVPARKK